MSILKSFPARLGISLITVNVAAAMCIAACKEDSPGSMTGTWERANGTEYYFFDDSRFQQADRPGEQWIWKQKPSRVDLYGDGGAVDRLWKIEFLDAGLVRVIETDTFEIMRI